MMGETARPLDDLIIIKDYRLLNFVGRGGMGELYKAEMLEPKNGLPKGTPVVVKQLFLEFPAFLQQEVREQREKSFKREAEALQAIQHPAAPKYVDDFIQRDRGYLVFEYVEGKTLEQAVLDGTPLSEHDAVDIATQVLGFLQYIHTSFYPPIIHRDIKPENILINEKSEVRVLDFGAVTDSMFTLTGTQGLGTLAYAPIEQMRGHPAPASDIFALGRTLIRILSKKPLLDMMKKGELEYQKHVNISADFRAILDKMTALEVEDRYSSAADVLKDLEGLKETGIISLVPRDPALIGDKSLLRNVDLSGYVPLLSRGAALTRVQVKDTPKDYLRAFSARQHELSLRVVEQNELSLKVLGGDSLVAEQFQSLESLTQQMQFTDMQKWYGWKDPEIGKVLGFIIGGVGGAISGGYCGHAVMPFDPVGGMIFIGFVGACAGGILSVVIGDAIDSSTRPPKPTYKLGPIRAGDFVICDHDKKDVMAYVTGEQNGNITIAYETATKEQRTFTKAEIAKDKVYVVLEPRAYVPIPPGIIKDLPNKTPFLALDTDRPYPLFGFKGVDYPDRLVLSSSYNANDTIHDTVHDVAHTILFKDIEEGHTKVYVYGVR